MHKVFKNKAQGCSTPLRENVNVTCKIVTFLYSLDNCLQKNVIVFFFRKSNFNMALIGKKCYFDLLFTFFSYQEKDTKIPSAHIPLTLHTPYWPFFLSNFAKNCEFIMYGFSLVWLLVLILFWSHKMVSKI